MTTAFELAASTNPYLPWTINQAGDPYSVYNSLSRSASREAQPTATSATAQQDTASISATSVFLAVAETEAATRAERIAALRQNLADGTYSVSAYRVATSLLQSLV